MSVRSTLKAYPTLLKVGLAEAVAYRAEFLVWMLTMTMPLVMLALMSAVAREAPIGRFDQNSFVSYYLTTLIVRQMTGAWVVWELVREVREGTLALRLLRPIHPLVGHSADSLAAIPMRGLIVLPVAAIMLLLTSGHDVTHDPWIVVMFLASLGGAWLLNFAVSATIGTLALFMESSMSIWELWLGCFMIFSGYLLPLELFPPWLERFARLLPFAYLQAVPVEMLIGLHGRAEAFRALGWQWLYAACAVAGMLLFWKRATRRFAAFGG